MEFTILEELSIDTYDWPKPYILYHKSGLLVTQNMIG
jgi:hypothetical protein